MGRRNSGIIYNELEIARLQLLLFQYSWLDFSLKKKNFGIIFNELKRA